MADLLPWFSAMAVLVAALASIALWSRRRRSVKVGALALVAILLPTGYFALVELLSRPKPMVLEWAPPTKEDSTVLASQLQEGVAIYIWLVRHDAPEPRAYVLPWDEKLARELHESRRKAERDGGAVRVRMQQAQQRIEGKRMFYVEPQQAPPAKQFAIGPSDGPQLEQRFEPAN